ncbi:unnamed protein product [Camellia sinensis]
MKRNRSSGEAAMGLAERGRMFGGNVWSRLHSTIANPLNLRPLASSYTQYIPLAISDLDSWLKTPSIYVFDRFATGMIVNAFVECFYFFWIFPKGLHSACSL